MGALKGSSSFTRFFIEGDANASSDTMEKHIESRRFVPIGPLSEAMESVGWVPLEDPFNDERQVTRDTFAFGDLIAIAYREDKITIPKPLLRREVRKRMEEIAVEEKKDIDEMGRAFIKSLEASVLRDLKAKAIPRSKVVEVVWDIKAKELRVFGTGTIATERIASLFERTFQVRVEQATYAARAFTLDLGSKAKVLEKLSPGWFFTGQEDFAGATMGAAPGSAGRLEPAAKLPEAPADDGKDTSVRGLAEKQFLGPEFLTWLYFTLRREGYEVEMPLPASIPHDDDIVRFSMGSKAQLKALDGTGAKVNLAGTGLDDNGEILQAIRRGALIEVLSVDMAIGSRVYALTLKADGTLTGVKLPDLFTDESEDDAAQAEEEAKIAGKGGKKKRRPKLPLEDVLALRAQCLSEVATVVDILFASFMPRRLAKAWNTDDVADIKRVVITGLRDRIAA